MEIPIYIDGVRTGTLRIDREGESMRLRAQLSDPGRVVRLTVYGEGAFYLGVPTPERGGLTWERTLTPAESRRFPKSPRYCAERPRESEAAPRHVLWFGGKPNFF